MVDSSSDRCRFTFDPDAWEAETGKTSPLSDDVLDSSGVWHCPHESSEGRDRCLLHLPVEEKDAAAVRDTFRSKIEAEGRAAKQFIGARFGELDLDHAIIECRDNHMIDLRHARFEGETSWWYTIVRQPITFEGALFRARPTFSETEFDGEVYLNKTRFEAPARFLSAEFTEGVWGNQASFTEANFHRATFGGPVDFSEVRFENAQFREAQFEGEARFTKASFETVTFTGSFFGEHLYLDQGTFPERVHIRHATIDGLVAIEDVSLRTTHCYVDLGKSTIPDGRLSLPRRETLVYNLADATLGDVTLVAGTAPGELFDHYRFLHTTFDGFDFGRYRDALNAAGWQLHGVVDSPIETARTATPTDGDLESTYLKAKNGANDIGDTKAAAEFFRHEMLYRRDQYLRTVRDRSKHPRTRVTAIGRWSANALLDLTAGYGERPSRVVSASVGTIGLFALLFAVARPTPPYGTVLGYLILSLESFVTLVLGGADEIVDPWIRLLAQIEGFFGAFFIALFVFTLTRSIHR